MQSYHNEGIFYKTIFGGMTTLIIFTFSLIFAINQLYIWGSGQMIYKVSSQRKNGFNDQKEQISIFKENSNYVNYFEFQVFSNNDSMLSPFNPTQVILLPLLINQQTAEISSLLENQKEGFHFAQMNTFGTQDFIIIFANCKGNELYLNWDQQCADQELIDQFYSEKGIVINANIYSDKIDYSSELIENITSVLSIPLDTQYGISVNILYEFNIINSRKGFLFQENKQFVLNNDFSTYSQTSSKEYLTNYMEFFLPISNVYLALWMSKNFNFTETQVQYPSISEVLANIASIFQTLLLTRYFMNWINRIKLYSYMQDSLANLYYPELQQIKVIKTEKQEKIMLKNREIEKTSFKNFKKELSKFLAQKFNYINLMNEIFQMQKLLLQIANQQQLEIFKINCAESLSFQKEEDIFKITNFCKPTFYNSVFNPFFFCLDTSQKNDCLDQELLVINSKHEQINTLKLEKYPDIRKKFVSDHQIQY